MMDWLEVLWVICSSIVVLWIILFLLGFGWYFIELGIEKLKRRKEIK